MTYLENATIELASSAAAPAVARQFVEQHSDHLPAELVADAELLVSELVTNAVRHGKPRITLQVRLQPPLMGVLVSDAGEDLPHTDVHIPSPHAGTGRGLLIVERTSSEWGVLPADAGQGKTIWFELTADHY